MNAPTRRAVATLLILIDVVLLLWALVLGFHIEGTTGAIAEAERGQRVAIPTVVSLLAAVVTLLAGRWRWSVAILVVSALAAATAVAVGLLT